MAESRDQYPSFEELADRTDAPAGSTWGVFGEGDQLGCLNFLSSEGVVEAATLIQKGKVFRLDTVVRTEEDAIFGRGRATHTHFHWPGILSFDDVLDKYNTQEGAQWDGFAHVGHPALQMFYNGTRPDEIQPGISSKLSIHHWRDRMVGRGVLADLFRYFRARNKVIDPLSPQEFSVDDIIATLDWQETKLVPNSVVLVRTGFSSAYESASEEDRARLKSSIRDPRRTACGIRSDERLWAWLWDNRVAALATDGPAVEPMPWDRDDVNSLHYRALALMGLPLGEQFNLEELAGDCATDGVREFFFVAAPIPLTGGVASPANSLAIK